MTACERQSIPFRLTRESALSIAVRIVPEYAEVLSELQRGGGWFRLKPRLVSYLSRIGTYVKLYESETKLNVAFAAGLLGIESLQRFNDASSMNERDHKQFLAELESELSMSDDLFESLVLQSDQEGVDSGRQLEVLSKDLEKAAGVRAALFCAGTFGGFFNCLSLMVHGEKLTTLVPCAIGGDTGAFLKAVQVDRMLLIHHPYFQSRKQLAQDVGDTDFLRGLASVEAGPPVRGRIRYPALYMLFGVLDILGWLDDLRHTEILDLCEQARLDRYQNRIEDVGYLTKMLLAYKRAHRNG